MGHRQLKATVLGAIFYGDCIAEAVYSNYQM